jgi:hypothetical protein
MYSHLTSVSGLELLPLRVAVEPESRAVFVKPEAVSAADASVRNRGASLDAGKVDAATAGAHVRPTAANISAGDVHIRSARVDADATKVRVPSAGANADIAKVDAENADVDVHSAAVSDISCVVSAGNDTFYAVNSPVLAVVAGNSSRPVCLRVMSWLPDNSPALQGWEIHAQHGASPVRDERALVMA